MDSRLRNDTKSQAKPSLKYSKSPTDTDFSPFIYQLFPYQTISCTNTQSVYVCPHFLSSNSGRHNIDFHQLCQIKDELVIVMLNFILSFVKLAAVLITRYTHCYGNNCSRQKKFIHEDKKCFLL